MSENGKPPSSWCETPIGTLATLVRGVSYVKDEARTVSAPGHTLLLRANNIGEGLSFHDVYYVPDRFVSDEQLLRDGDVVIAMSSGSKSIVGKAALASSVPRSSFGAFCGVVRPTRLIDFRYFGYYFQTKSYRQGVSQASKGTGINNLKSEHILDRSLPLPPKPEQARIASKVDELFSSIDEGERALERVRKLVERYRQSVLKAAVTGELTREWREQQAGELESGETLLTRILEARRQAWEESELAKVNTAAKKTSPDAWRKNYRQPVAPETPPCGIPDGWAWVTLDQIAECLDFARRPINRTARAARHGLVPYYGANGQVGTIDSYLFDEPLVLIVEDETFTGRTQPFSYKITGKAWVNNHAHILRPAGQTNVDFLNAALMRYPFIPLTKGTTARRKLTQQSLLAAPLALPPLCEQLRIMSSLDAALTLLRPVEQELLRAEALLTSLRQSILKAAFSGQLVPRDPTDEPASVLLERIAAERVAAPKRAATKRVRQKKTRSKSKL